MWARSNPNLALPTAIGPQTCRRRFRGQRSSTLDGDLTRICSGRRDSRVALTLRESLEAFHVPAMCRPDRTTREQPTESRQESAEAEVLGGNKARQVRVQLNEVHVDVHRRALPFEVEPHVLR